MELRRHNSIWLVDFDKLFLLEVGTKLQWFGAILSHKQDGQISNN